jgi:hypothetical protein
MRPLETPSALLRWISEGRLSSAYQHYVLEDSERCIALWQPSETIGRVATGQRGGPRGRNMVPGGWDGNYTDRVWTGDSVLRVYVPGQPWSTWRWLTADGWTDYAYVNLEAPWVRTPIGFDTADWILDVIAESDGSYSLKDEDELEWAIESGKYSVEFVATVRAACRAAIAAIDEHAFPFDADWKSWSPLPTLPLTISDGWDILSADA